MLKTIDKFSSLSIITASFVLFMGWVFVIKRHQRGRRGVIYEPGQRLLFGFELSSSICIKKIKRVP